ncbi:heme o synthase [Propioniciclava flava]|uniref:Protoheme IX farnesyltransferase n=1 Tax=Propioniciclava flava TaxID=2072026 RepID=A0A4Q2EH83_9ACTN|nr:heme o synthase [Propioniciclava flava]RXW32413.1 protoheme IX farnesyltransferase [Propioniciclava flava]
MHPSRTETSPVTAPGLKGTLLAYVGLTKPRIIELLLVTTFPAMFLAAHGFPPLGLAAVTFVGGTLSAASANVFNSVLDADIDEQMRRTRRRPMVREQVSARAAYIFAVVLGIGSVLMLGFGANWLSAALSVTAILYYVIIYTVWLKRRTPLNIVWGGVAGCFPPLIGWTAVTGSVAWPPLILFLIVFFWTPPHTWALGLRYREDYAGADVPMLPVVREATYVTRQMLAYSVLTVLTSMALWPVASTGWLYPVVAGVSGIVLIMEAIALMRRADAGLSEAKLAPMRLFHWSNSYLAIVFIAAAVDALIF